MMYNRKPMVTQNLNKNCLENLNLKLSTFVQLSSINCINFGEKKDFLKLTLRFAKIEPIRIFVMKKMLRQADKLLS